MSMMLMISIALMAILLIIGKLWEKMLALSSLGMKIAILIILISYETKLTFLYDVGLLYLMAGGAGIILLLFLILRSELE